jgi:DNA-binding MarR family transcriptional regulator
MSVVDCADTFPSDTEALLTAVTLAGRALDNLMERSIAAVNQRVTLEQYRTLALLALYGSQSSSALAERCGVHTSTMSRMCERLVARHLIVRTRSPRDHREVMVQLSTLGTTFLHKVTIVFERSMEAVRDIDPADRGAAVRALHNLAAAATEQPIPRRIT